MKPGFLERMSHKFNSLGHNMGCFCIETLRAVWISTELHVEPIYYSTPDSVGLTREESPGELRGMFQISLCFI